MMNQYKLKQILNLYMSINGLKKSKYFKKLKISNSIQCEFQVSTVIKKKIISLNQISTKFSYFLFFLYFVFFFCH